MPDHRVILSLLDYGLETALLFYLLVRVMRRRAGGLAGVAAYMAVSLGVGGLRLYFAAHSGARSFEYALCYWLTDYALVFAVFLLIASFFRRACSERPEAWRRVRLMLASALILTAAVSSVTILHRGRAFFLYFVVQFQQNLYFACLVLTTMLYLMVVKFEPADEQIGLLVSGIGLAFAGFAASYALVFATRWAPLAGRLSGYIPQLSDMAMVSIWFYTVAWVPMSVHTREEDGSTREALPARGLAQELSRS